jgi:hypothetical protein
MKKQRPEKSHCIKQNRGCRAEKIEMANNRLLLTKIPSKGAHPKAEKTRLPTLI